MWIVEPIGTGMVNLSTKKGLRVSMVSWSATGKLHSYTPKSWIKCVSKSGAKKMELYGTVCWQFHDQSLPNTHGQAEKMGITCFKLSLMASQSSFSAVLFMFLQTKYSTNQTSTSRFTEVKPYFLASINLLVVSTWLPKWLKHIQ